MAYNDAFTKMVGDTSATFNTEITALQDNVTSEIGAPVLEGGKYKAKGDLNEIIQEIINNDVLLKAIADKLRVDLDAHSNNKNNPHITTKAQVDLGNVENYTVTSSVSDASNTKYATAGAVKAVNDSVNIHAGKVDNPHKVTKAQVGLGEVQNYPVTSAVNDASNTKYATAGAVKVVQENANSRVSKSGDTITGNIHNNASGNLEGLNIFTRGGNLSTTGAIVGGIQANWYTFVAKFGICRGAGADIPIDGLRFKLNNNTYKVFHEGFKPTASDVEAVSKSGDTMTGDLTIEGDNRFINFYDGNKIGKKSGQGLTLQFLKNGNVVFETSEGVALRVDKNGNLTRGDSNTYIHTGNIKNNYGKSTELIWSGSLSAGNFTIGKPYDQFDAICFVGGENTVGRRYSNVIPSVELSNSLIEILGLPSYSGGSSLAFSCWRGSFSADKRTFVTKDETGTILAVYGIRYGV